MNKKILTCGEIFVEETSFTVNLRKGDRVVGLQGHISSPTSNPRIENF